MTNFRRQLSVILVILPAIVRARHECCKDGVAVQASNVSACEDGELIQLDCNGGKSTLSNERGHKYELITENQETVLHAPETGYKWREINFCEGYSKTAGNQSSTRIAVVCDDRVILQGSLHAALMKFANFKSILALAITAFLYFYLPEMKNTEGRCSFHLSLSMGIGHANYLYAITRTADPSSDWCITRMYLAIFFVLSSFCWTANISFDMWNRTRSNRPIDESKQICRYYCFGYGVPGGLIFMSNVVLHVGKLYSESRLNLDCSEHRTTMKKYFMILPLAVILLSNLFFFIDVQRRLWKIQPSGQQIGNFPLKKLKYRLSMYGKLFFIMGIPWLCFSISTFLKFQFLLLLSGEGVLTFLMLVVFRPRMCKAISRRWPAFKKLSMKTADYDAESLTEDLTEEFPYDANGINLETREAENATSAGDL